MVIPGFLLQLLSLVERRDGVDDRVKMPLHHRLELIQSQADAMVGHAILFEVIRADLFASIARAHHALSIAAQLCALLLDFDLIQPRPEYLESLRPVLYLRLLVLAGDY